MSLIVPTRPHYCATAGYPDPQLTSSFQREAGPRQAVEPAPIPPAVARSLRNIRREVVVDVEGRTAMK